MDWIMIALSSVLLAAAVLLLWKRKRDAQRKYQETCLSRLEEVAHTAELTKRACFTSLEKLHDRLETLQTRADAAEQRLSSMVEPPQLERKEHYYAAALLLAGGNSAERVAAMLALPLSQVELVQELQKSTRPENDLAQPHKPAAAAKTVRPRRKKKAAAHGGRARVRPILLTDVVRLDGAAAKAEAAA
jgi:hypothetical protein